MTNKSQDTKGVKPKNTISDRVRVLLIQKRNVEAELAELIILRDESKPKTGAKGKGKRTEAQKVQRSGRKAIVKDANKRITKMVQLIDLMVTIRTMKKHTNHSVTKLLVMAENLLANLKDS